MCTLIMNDYDLCANTGETQLQLLLLVLRLLLLLLPLALLLLICVVWASRAFKICHPAKCLKALERELQQRATGSTGSRQQAAGR